MMTFHRKRGGRDKGRGHDPYRDSPPENAAEAELDLSDGEQVAAVAVLLSPGLVELAPSLTQALGGGFSVRTDGPCTSGVMIFGPVGPAGVAFLRASHPGVVLLVIDRRWPSSQPAEAVTHLEAGADGYLSSPLVAEVASHVRALVRRADHNGLTAPVPAPLSPPVSAA